MVLDTCEIELTEKLIVLTVAIVPFAASLSPLGSDSKKHLDISMRSINCIIPSSGCLGTNANKPHSL
jgi:hypothetical protein